MSTNDAPKTADRGSELNDQLGQAPAHCWPWSHVYSAWVDTHDVEKRRTFDGAIVASGKRQQRRCLRCGKLKLRLVLAGVA